MGSTNAMLTQMIQDAVLKLCTQNVVFNKSLEIDGIICVSPGDEAKEIVVKMHRTIVKPNEPQTPAQPVWSASPSQIPTDSYYTGGPQQSPRQYPSDTFPNPNQRRPGPITSQRQKPAPIRPKIPQSPMRDNNRTPQSPMGNTPTVTQSPYYSPAEPSATQVAPGGPLGQSEGVTVKEEPPSSPRRIKRSLSDDTQQDTPEHSTEKQPKLDQTPGATDNQNTNNINIKQEKEEPITIELGDDDDEEEDGGGGYDEDSTAGASWMGDNTLDTSQDNMADNSMADQSSAQQYEYYGVEDNMLQLRDSDNQSAQSFGHGAFKGSNIQRYVCSVCHKVMTRKDHYSYHMKTHTGEKPHKCPLCLKEFRQPSDLKRHQKRVHGFAHNQKQ
ncbi:unnamed protein product [Owenia fusiformis]|uniref:C2H2-type domain-containing protein n=1 Tax=Owenia fusiformis TaxID=6347 RepID=A0A8S4NA41_OWEFU|nr:unnamed protein product [Owenia fusiformis]